MSSIYLFKSTNVWLTALVPPPRTTVRGRSVNNYQYTYYSIESDTIVFFRRYHNTLG